MRTLQLIKTTLVVSLLDWPQDGLNYDRPRRFASYTSFLQQELVWQSLGMTVFEEMA